MKYVMMIYTDPVARGAVPTEEREAEYAQYMTYTQDVNNRGAYKGGEALQPATTATTVRVRNGEILKTDGPYAETKEQIGGFYILDCKDLDEAIELGSRIPSAVHGYIEIRPALGMD